MIITENPKFRVTSGGSYNEFDTEDAAIDYLIKMLKKFNYGSINKVYTFRRIDDN